MKLKAELEQLMAVYSFSPRAYLSQNFLIDPRVVSRLIAEIKLEEKDLVLEIGAGTGVLTSQLIEKAAKVWAVEVDGTLCKVLTDKFGASSNLEIIERDIAKVDFDNLFSGVHSIKVIGNLPYHIATRIILDFVTKKWWKSMLFTIQREVAERILSSPGKKTRGALTVNTSYYVTVERIMDIPAQAFFPIPKVTSTVMSMKPRKIKIEAKNERLFLDVVSASFSNRRKTLLNSLSRGLNLPRDFTQNILRSAKIPEKIRAEQMEVEDFVRMSNVLLEKRRDDAFCCKN